MDYPHPLDFSTHLYPLLLQNGCWVVPCVWMDVVTLQKALSVPSHPFVTAPFALPASEGVSSSLYGLPVLPSPESAPMQHNPQLEHAFGPPPAIPEIDISNLSAEEQSLLWNAPFPLVDHTGPDTLSGMEFQSEPTAFQSCCLFANQI